MAEIQIKKKKKNNPNLFVFSTLLQFKFIYYYHYKMADNSKIQIQEFLLNINDKSTTFYLAITKFLN